MIERMYQSTEKLSGSEARNLLVNMMIKIKNMRELESLQAEMLEDLYSLYTKPLESQKNKVEI